MIHAKTPSAKTPSNRTAQNDSDHLMDLAAKRELNNGFGDSLSRAFELAVTPAVFAGFGYLIDRLLGIVPVFTIALLVLAVFGELVLWWYRYDYKMSQLEQELIAKRSVGSDDQAPSQGSVKAPVKAKVFDDARLPTGITLDSSLPTVDPMGATEPEEAR